VIAVYAGRLLENGISYALFNCGLPAYIRKDDTGKAVLQPGDLVRLERISLAKGSWEISDWKPLPAVQLPAHSKLTLKYLPANGQPFGRISLLRDSDHSPLPENKIDQAGFFVDISRFFCGAQDTYEVYARYNGTVYEPVWAFLPELLLESNPHKQLTLTYIKEGSFEGRKGWLFSLMPGRNYLLFDSDFYHDESNSDVQHIRDKLVKLQGSGLHAQGLLVSFAPVSKGQKIVLQLAEAGPADSTPDWQGYPGLSKPFDQRNIHWKRWFQLMDEQDELLTALPANDGCYLRVKAALVPGFPDIRLDRMDAAQAYKEVVVNQKDWTDEQQRTARVKATPVQSYNLCQANEARLAKFIPEYLDWQEQSPLMIRMIIGANWQQNGEFNCLSSEGVTVRLEMESLSMKPAPEDLQVLADDLTRRHFIVSKLSAWKQVKAGSEESGTFRLAEGDVVKAYFGNTLRSLSGVITEKPKAEEADWCKVAWLTETGIRSEVVQLRRLSEVK
ncbi:MAG: hypothetical protein V4577_13840, partial [Bacteroidota bacterium]